MEATIKIQRTEYAILKDIAKRYDLLRKTFSATYFEEPPVTSRKEVLKAFKGTGKYNAAFLKSLEAGLSESSYFT